MPRTRDTGEDGSDLDAEARRVESLRARFDAGRNSSERRGSGRRSYSAKVEAQFAGETLVLRGRDLSAGGMRTEPCPDIALGDELELALCGSDAPDPLRMRAVVKRDDGAHGWFLAFCDVSPEDAERLHGLLHSLPVLEPPRIRALRLPRSVRQER